MQLFKMSGWAESGRATVQSAEVFGGTITLELKLCLHQNCFTEYESNGESPC